MNRKENTYPGPGSVAQERVYDNASRYVDDLCQTIDAAISSVDLETYILSDDSVGQRVLEALERAVKRGVTVRMVVDGIGSMSWIARELITETWKSIPCRVFHPPPGFSLALRLSLFQQFSDFFTGLFSINRRTHKKIAIVDNRVLFTGSINLWQTAVESLEAGISISPVDPVALDSFEYSWKRSRVISAGRIYLKPPVISPRPVSSTHVRTNHTITKRKHENRRLVAAIAHARERVWLMTPYFVPPVSLVNALVRAAEQGIDVRLVLSEQSDHFFMPFLARNFTMYLARHGVRVFQFSQCFLHAKVSLIDGSSIIGSTNMNHRSFYHDLELDVVTRNSDSDRSVMELFRKTCSRSRELSTDDFDRTPLLQRIAMRFLLLIKNWS